MACLRKCVSLRADVPRDDRAEQRERVGVVDADREDLPYLTRRAFEDDDAVAHGAAGELEEVLVIESGCSQKSGG